MLDNTGAFRYNTGIVNILRFLRPFLETDAADVYEYLKEPSVNCFACMKLSSLAEAKEEMKKRLGETEYYFAITLKETGKVIGDVNVWIDVHLVPFSAEV